LLRASAIPALTLLGQQFDGYAGRPDGSSNLVESSGLKVPFAGGRNVIRGIAGAVPSTVNTAPNCSHVVAAQPVVMLTILMIEVPPLAT
jgi:hypothetical protein